MLVLVDYADRWPDEALRLLPGHEHLADVGALPVRMLLLARTDAFWPALRDDLDKNGYACTAHHLPLLGADVPGVQERRHSCGVAAAEFTRRLQLDAPPPGQPVPSELDLSAPGFGLVLAVHMAALASVLARRDGQQPPRTPGEVSRFLLNRERGHWTKMAARAPATATISEALMGRAVLLATLVQRASHRDALTLVSRPEFGTDPQGLLELHERCYPPTVPGLVLEP